MIMWTKQGFTIYDVRFMMFDWRNHKSKIVHRKSKTWHFRHDWSFTPFVVVVGGKYFLPVPECLLFDRA